MSTPSPTMQALLFHGPDASPALTLTTIPAPSPAFLAPNEVLIRVAAAGLIGAELTWRPHPTSTTSPSAAHHHIVCPDYAGTIAALGSAVTSFRLGDPVMAVSVDFDMAAGVTRYPGGAAEWAVAPAAWTTRIPGNVALRDAGGIPLCAYTAWQAMGEVSGGRVKAGTEVLVLGAAGATGLWLVQVAKLKGARVTGTASDAEGIARLRELGADEVVNYKTEDVEARGRRFDLVVDAVGGKVFQQGLKVVKSAKDGGRVVSIVEYEAKAAAPADVEAKFFIWRPNQAQMLEMVELIEAGKLKPVTDSCFPLHQGIEAFAHAGNGHCHGKVILEV